MKKSIKKWETEGSIIKEERKKKEMTQKEVAAMAHISTNYLSQIETGIRNAYSTGALAVIYSLEMSREDFEEKVKEEKEKRKVIEMSFEEAIAKLVDCCSVEINEDKPSPILIWDEDEVYSFIRDYDEVQDSMYGFTDSDERYAAWEWEKSNTLTVIYAPVEDRIIGVRGFGKTELLTRYIPWVSGLVCINEACFIYCQNTRDVKETAKDVCKSFYQYICDVKEKAEAQGKKPLVIFGRISGNDYVAQYLNQDGSGERAIIKNFKAYHDDYTVESVEGDKLNPEDFFIDIPDDEISFRLGLNVAGMLFKRRTMSDRWYPRPPHEIKSLELTEAQKEVYELSVQALNRSFEEDLGDENRETYVFLESAVDRLENLVKITAPDVIISNEVFLLVKKLRRIEFISEKEADRLYKKLDDEIKEKFRRLRGE